jgi:predicted ATPase
MLTKLRIRNFKAWRDTGEIRLAPITVFFGTNSSGKTSLLQLLLMLKQTAASPDRQRVLHLGDRTTPVDLGTFHDLVFDHNKLLPLRFEIAWDLDEPLRIRDALRLKAKPLLGSLVHFSAEIKGPVPLTVADLTYKVSNGASISASLQPKPGKKNAYELHAWGYELRRNPGRPWPLPPPTKFYGFPDEAIAYFQNSSFVADLALSMENLLASIHYIGPLREYPQRAYLWSGEVPEDVGQRGERAVEAILAARNRQFNRGPRARREPFEQVIAGRLRDMDLIDSFEVKLIAENRKEHEVLIKTRPSSSQVLLTDVGFGLSQVLPVIVQCFYVPRNSVLIFEQPEIHLHPKVQASLADLFVDAIRAREEARDRRIQVIVESHSEHFLRRMQTLLAEGKLAREETALYFCEPGPEGSLLRELDLDEFGQIRNWPQDFFGDITGEVEKQTRRRLERLEKSRHT